MGCGRALPAAPFPARLATPAAMGDYAPALMFKLTGTPLVTMSYTAERARDCSTIWRNFSGGASPSISKLTWMRS